MNRDLDIAVAEAICRAFLRAVREEDEPEWYEPGRRYAFYGVDDLAFKLDVTVYRAIENPDDGYRSYLDSIVVEDATGLIFAREPLAEVTIVPVLEDGFNAYEFRDTTTGHCWLTIGTADDGDYYPLFVFRYTPPEGRTSDD